MRTLNKVVWQMLLVPGPYFLQTLTCQRPLTPVAVSLYLRTLVAGADLISDRSRPIVPRVNAPQMVGRE